MSISPEESPKILTDLIDKCSKISSEERPTFKNILEYCKQNTTHN